MRAYGESSLAADASFTASEDEHRMPQACPVAAANRDSYLVRLARISTDDMLIVPEAAQME